MSNNIDELKALIIQHESLDNILIKSGNTYDVVFCYLTVLDAEDKEYIFNVEGYSCYFNINEIDNWCYAKDCFNT